MTGFTLTNGLSFSGGFSLSQTSATPWTPAKLFENGNTGFWYDPSSFYNLNQTATVTTPVSTFEQNVGAIFDFSTGQTPFPRVNLLSYTENFTNGYWGKFDTTVTANATTAPDSTNTANLLVPNTNNTAHLIAINNILPDGITTPIIVSIYAKAAGYNYALVRINGDASNRFISGSFDLINGTAAIYYGSGNSGVAGSVAITDAGNGWYQCLLTVTTWGNLRTLYVPRYDVSSTGVPDANFFGAQSFAGNNVSGVYFWGADLRYVGAIGVPSYQPIIGIAPTPPVNLLLYSEEFENAVWNSSINRISVTANDTAGPFVNTFGDRLTTIAGGASGSSIYQATSKTSGTTYTFSVYVKAGNVNRVIVTNRNSAGSYTEGVFDLSSGTWVNGGATGVAVNIGSGWYRLSQTSASNGTGTWENYVGPINNAGTAFNNVTNGNYIFVYGAQQEAGATASTYTKNVQSTWPGNSAAQATAGSRGLIRARYNIAERTEEIDNGYWGKFGASVGTNAIAAPDSTVTAESLTENSSNSAHVIFKNGLITTTVSTAAPYYRFAVFAKADSRTAFFIGARDESTTTSWASACFDLVTGTVSKTGQSGSTRYINSGIESVGNSWYYCYIDVAGSFTGLAIGPSNTTNPTFGNYGEVNYLGNGTGRMYFWGIDVRPGGAAPNLPNYQDVVSSTSYINTAFNTATLFPQGIFLDGTDDFYTTTGGGAFTSFFFAAGIQINSFANFSQVLFSDLNGNSGIKIWITNYGELALTLGNGLTTTTINTTLVCTLFNRNVVMAWYNGTNIFVQLDDGSPIAFSYYGLSPGTDTITIGKDNGSSTGYYNGIMYAMLYTKNLSPTQDDVDGALAYCQQSNLSPLNADTISPVNVTQVPVYPIIQSTQININVTQVPVYAFVKTDTEGILAVTQVPVYINIKEQDNLLVTQLAVYAISIL